MKTIPQVIRAEYLGDYRLRLLFKDGRQGEVDLQPELYGEIFEPLKDKAVFAKLSVNPDLHTVVWPNGADFAPEFLYELCERPFEKAAE
jgi:hypothetical protein